MNNLRGFLANFHRPKLLVRAARHGLQDYDRKRDLKRIAGTGSVDNSSALISHLVEQEEHIEASRKTGCATYSVARHIAILVAIMHECNLLPKELRAG